MVASHTLLEGKNLTVEAETDPDGHLATLTESTQQRLTWLKERNELHEQMKCDGGLRIGSSREEVVEKYIRPRLPEKLDEFIGAFVERMDLPTWLQRNATTCANCM